MEMQRLRYSRRRFAKECRLGRVVGGLQRSANLVEEEGDVKAAVNGDER